MDRKEIIDNVTFCRLELTDSRRELLCLSRHRENLFNDSNITENLKNPILIVIDSQILLLKSECDVLENKISHYDNLLDM